MKKALIFVIAVLFAVGTALSQEPQPGPAAQQDVKYTNDSVARLSFVTGKAFVQRASDLGYEEAVLNMPISEGDRIGTSEGRAEIHFGRGNYLRLDNDTKVDVLNLPKKGDDITRLRVWSGSIYVVVGVLAKEKAIEIHTADSSFYVLDKGIYRIDAKENQNTQLFVFDGLIEAAGEQGSNLVKSGQKLEISEGRFTSKPANFVASAEDSFDRFNQSRGTETGRQFAKKYLPEDLQDYEGELSDNGRWVYNAPYGNVWVPNGVDEDWRPYWNGRWTWLPISGWTWWPYEPWGWATFHYGRWHWGLDLGWYWIPMNMWGPGWVDWWWDDMYFGWAPMSWYGYPGVLLGGAYYGGFYGHNYPFGSRALTIIRRDQLKSPNASRVALRGDALKNLTNIRMTNTTLGLRPAGTRISVQPLDGKRVMLRNSGGSGTLVPDRSIRTNPAGSSVSKPAGSTQGKPTEASKVKQSGKSGDSGAARSSGSSRGSGSSSSGRNIRKKDDSPASSASLSQAPSNSFAGQGQTAGVRNSSPRTIHGYPSSPAITRSSAYGDGGVGRSSTYLGRYSGSSSGRSYGSSSSTRSSGSSGARSSSRGSSSSSRGSVSRGSSGSHSSGSHSSGGRHR